MIFRRYAVWLALFAQMSFVVGCHSGDEETNSSSAGSGATAPQISLGGAGSTFLNPIMTDWISGFKKGHPGAVVMYRAIGSGKGIEEFQSRYLDFGATDAALSDEELQKMPPAIQIPVTAGPVCIIYNLPGLDKPLRLSANALAGIFLGTIVMWQDPIIAKDNPGVRIPKAPIIVVHRSDGSGTTSILTTYLEKINQEWSRRVGHGISVKWPVGIGASGSQGIVDLMRQTPGTVGYAELNYAAENKLSFASIQNRAGVFEAPSPTGTAASIAAFQQDLAKDVRAPIVDPPATAKDAYPISGLSFLLLRKTSATGEPRPDLAQFAGYILDEGQNGAEHLGYSPLPEALRQVDQKLVSALTAPSQQPH